MIFWKTYFLREVKLAACEGGTWFFGAIQTLLCGILFPLALSPSPALLPNLAVGIIWSCALLGCLIPIDGVFANDLEDGSLDMLLCQNISLKTAALVKILAIWSVRSLPVIAAGGLLSLFFNYPFSNLPTLLATLCIGTLIFCFLGAMTATFIPLGRKGNSLAGLLLLPLCMPVVIFGTLANSPTDIRIIAFDILAGLLFLTIPLCTIVMGIALREQVSQI